MDDDERRSINIREDIEAQTTEKVDGYSHFASNTYTRCRG